MGAGAEAAPINLLLVLFSSRFTLAADELCIAAVRLR